MENLYEKIKEAKEALGEKAALIIASELPIENWNEEKLSGKSPFNDKDNTPSFLWNAKENCFKDFSTGKNYGIIDFYMDKYSCNFVSAAKKLFDLVGVKYADNEFKILKTSKENFFDNYKYPKEETNSDRDKVESYLSKRGISIKTLDYMGVKQDLHGNVVFELRDVEDRLLAVKYRPSRAVSKSEPKMWWQKNADMCPSLYNINRVDITKPLVIVEGFIDALSVVEAGYKNVVSIHGGAEDLSWIEFNYDFLQSVNKIILWFDNDKAGQSGLQKAVSRIGEYKCRVVKPTADHEDAVEQYYKTYNTGLSVRKTDANNILLACGKSTIINLIESAEEIPLNNIIDLMDVEEFDINKVGYTPTGFVDLDKEIYGYVDGTVNAWTAYSGVGKTTCITQSCVLEAVNRGETVFWFNAELTTNQMLDWFLTQSAGRDHTIEFTNPNGFKYYKPTIQAIKAIKSFYKDKILVYDNLLLTSPEDVLNKMKDVYNRRGTKIFVLDNWLCLNFQAKREEDVSAVQLDFLNRLIQFTKNNGLEVHIVSHPRKPQSGVPLTEYDILGTSNFVNLMDRIYGFEVPNDKKIKDLHFDRQFTVFKDRVLGKKGFRMGLKYDKATRRLYGENDNVYKKYSWDDGSIKYTSTQFGDNGTLIGRRILDIDAPSYDEPY